MKKLILVVTIMFSALLGNAQDFIDNALLFSRTKPGGSARIQAMGGAQVALGGDYSSAFSNPAGLGMYNRGEVTITPGLTFINARSTYFNETTDESRSVFNIPGLSVVIHSPSEADKGFLGGSFAISLNRINDLNIDYQFSGINNQSSIVDYFIQDANGVDPEDLLADGSYGYSLTGLAYRNYLIEDFQKNGEFVYDSRLLFNSGRQQEVSQRKGAQYQWSIAYGANFSDKFFAGATLGIATLRYKLNQVYTESDFQYPPDADVALRDFEMTEDYDIKGSGINLAIGVIYRPIEFFQIGASFTTPTYYQITDIYTANMRSTWNDYQYYPDTRLTSVYEEFDQPLVSEYSFTSPMKINTGIAFRSKIGMISTDVEYVNYSKAKYRSDIAGDFNNENGGIKSEYGGTLNFRVGAEYRYKDYRVRAGFNHQGDPVTSDINRSANNFSGGLGYRGKKFSVDLAAIFSKSEANRIPYVAGGAVPIAEQKFNYASYLLTLGFFF
jgi:hypothetical protein